MCISGLKRILYRAGLAALALLCVGLLTATVSAEPTSPVPVRYLPTRPPPPKPKPKPPSDQPKPEQPTAIPPTQAPPTPTPRPSLSVDVTFEELGHSTFELLDWATKDVDLYLPHNFIPNDVGGYLDLTISHTTPEPDKPPLLELTLNDAALGMVELSAENTQPTTYRFDLTDAPLTTGRNRLHILLDSAALCGSEGAEVSVTVYSSSLFHVEYSLAQLTPDLALYPIPFFERSFTHAPVYIVLPHQPTATDLSTGATIAAGLGKFSSGQIRLLSALDTQVPDAILENYHLIVVGKNGSNQLLGQLDLPLRIDDPSLSDEQGAIQELVSPWNPQRLVLVVTGRSDEALSQAGQALGRGIDPLVVQGSVAIVEPVTSTEQIESPLPDVEIKLADLGYVEQVVYGTQPHTLRYPFEMPAGFAAKEEPQFILYFDHAPTTNPPTSFLGVFLNGIPLRTVQLDQNNAHKQAVEISLPSRLIRSGQNEIRVDVQMDLEGEDKCQLLDSERLWTTIYSDSTFYLPLTLQDAAPSLDLFPYPFNKRPGLSDLLIILPNQTEESECDLMLRIASGLGAAAQGDSLALDVTTVGLVTQGDLYDRDLILIGRPSTHSMIADLNASLPQPFEPGSDQLRLQPESVAYVQDVAWHIGVIEELAAPWDPERTILVLTGTSDEGLALAGTALLSRDEALAGNVALVEESAGIHAWEAHGQPLSTESQARRPEIDQALVIRLGERWW